MANTLTSNTFSSTYKDDYSDENGYHRVLFNAGRALQARELTQLQTILQNQISRFGKNIFKEGAAVNPGGPSINPSYEFIKLNTDTYDADSVDATDIVGVEFTGGTSGVKAKILEVVASTETDPSTFYLQYTDTSAATAGETSIRFTPGELITGNGNTFEIQTTNTTSNPAIGTGVKFSNGAGDFFAQGFFVYSPAQSIILSKYNNTYTGIVGFKVIQDIVTVSDSQALYDNSGANYDLSAPGADRFRIRLELIDRDDVDSDENFVFFANIVNSRIIEQASGESDYNKIVDLMATRTFEESGNYIVNPFTLTVEDSETDDTKLLLNVSNGVAYVNGYRAVVPSDIKLEASKSQTTETATNQITAAGFGNYVIVNSDTDIHGTFGTSTHNKINLFANDDGTGTVLGTCRIRYVEEDGSDYKFYLYDITMNSTYQFRNVKSIGRGPDDYATLLLEGGKAVLKDATNRETLFPLQSQRPESLGDISLEVQRIYSALTTSTTSLTLPSLSGNENYVNTNDWVVMNDAGTLVENPSITGSGTQSATVTVPSSGTYTVFAKVDKGTGFVRTKTLTSKTDTITISSGVVDLEETDIYQVSVIKETNSSGRDISHLFTVDNGQRDSYYDIGKLNLNNGETFTGDVYVEFEYFEHGGAGDFFAVNSYTGQVSYENIPSYTATNGNTYELRDVLDFRNVIDADSPTVMGTIHELPANTDIVRADVTYYQSRKDKVVINTEGNLVLVSGTPGLNPQLPSTPENTIDLFRITFNPFTLSTSDLQNQIMKYKRYTMADIANIDQRLEDLRETTSLSLLELNTSTLTVMDEDGNQRTKSGFFVDNFVDHTFTDTSDPYNASAVDPSSGIMRPSFFSDAVDLAYNPGLSSGVTLSGDNVLLDYTEEKYIDQPQISGYENINPFSVITNRGTFTFSPESDVWSETRYIPARTVDGGIRLDMGSFTGGTWNNTIWNWIGNNQAELISSGLSTSSSSSRTSTSSTWNTRTTTTTNTTVSSAFNVVAAETITDVIGDRVISVAAIPTMRSVRINFKAEGLRPNTRYFPFFDGKNVSDWVRQDTGATELTRMSTSNYVIANAINATGHPDTATDLLSDEYGRIVGSFVVPSNDALKFATGTRNFKLLDISVNIEADALSSVRKDFTAAGLLTTRQQTIKSTRALTVNARTSVSRSSTSRTQTIWTDAEGEGSGESDPLAQSFFVDNREGAFITKVGIYFKTKSDSVAAQLQIRPMENGIPTTNIVPGAVKFLYPNEVNAFDDTGLLETQENINDNITYFEFDEPVYLSGGFEYAIVLLAETIDYQVYVAETEQFVIGSTEKRITKQPLMGSLFKSQNGSTWTPSQSQDLAFELYRADFASEGTVYLENNDINVESLIENPLTFTSGSPTLLISQYNHGFKVDDEVTLTGASTTNGISASLINKTHTITHVDPYSYKVTLSSNATSTGIGGGTGMTATRNILFDLITPYIETITPENTGFSISGTFTTGDSFAGSQTRYQQFGEYLDIQNKERLFFNSPMIIANPDNETSELGGNKSTTFKVQMATLNSWVSPVLDMQRTFMETVNNVIDSQVSGGNTVFTQVAETESTGGSSLAKHISTPVSLEDESTGLKVLLGANRPSDANIDVYYRTCSSDSILSEQSWTKASIVTEMPSDEDGVTFREYQYLVDDLDPFTEFQTKIVMRSINSSKVPVIKDLRVIALVV